MRSDLESQTVFCLPSNFHDTLDQVIEQTCVMNDIRVASRIMNSRQIVPERPVFSIDQSGSARSSDDGPTLKTRSRVSHLLFPH